MKYTKEQLDKFIKALKDFYKHKEEALDTIHKDKIAIQNIKTELLNSLIDNCHYIRDTNKIIISAPEIIIGNVDKFGVLLGDATSKVTIKAHNISNEGISSSDVRGMITNRATYIHNIAVNPGIDGMENEVEKNSHITLQAKGINLYATINKEYFCKPTSSHSGIKLITNSDITLETAETQESQRKRLTKDQEKLKNKLNELKLKIDNDIQEVEDDAKNINNELNELKEDEEIAPLSPLQDELKKNYKYDEKLTGHHFSIRLKRKKVDEQRKLFEVAASNLYRESNEYFRNVSEYSEAKRVYKLIQRDIEQLKGNNIAQGEICINSENISIVAKNDHENVSTDDNASINIRAKKINIDALQSNSELIKNSNLNIKTEHVDIDTSTRKVDKGKGITQKTANGSVRVSSLSTLITAYDKIPGTEGDNENILDTDGMKVKELANNGYFGVQTMVSEFNTITTKGEATGKFYVNSNEITLKSVDGKIEQDGNFSATTISKNSKFVASSETMEFGNCTDDIKTKHLQIIANKSVYAGNESVQLAQYKDMSSPQIAIEIGQNEISYSTNSIFHGPATFEGQTDFKDLIKGTSAEIQDLDVKTKFAAAGKLSATATGAFITKSNGQKYEIKSKLIKDEKVEEIKSSFSWIKGTKKKKH